MQTTVNCRRCGAPVPPGDGRAGLEGLCPRCVMGAALLTSGPAAASDGGDLPAGSRVGPYEVAEVVGRGGMGVVYRACQGSLERVVALKILSPALARDREFIGRFHREAKALASLSHPHIVTVYDFGVDGERPYLAMEFVEGVSLRALLAERRLTPKEALHLVPQICDALEYAHSQGVVHRDIKPENILMGREGRLKIADFGLAKMSVKGEATLTRTSVAMGTPQYMAPEQYEGMKDVDHRADIYSLGVIFYEMLTGEIPAGHFQLPSQKVRLDVRLDEIVLKALAKEPERRYQRAAQLKTDVETVISRPAAQPVSQAAEAVLMEGPANHWKGWEAVGGWLQLTSKELRFSSHGGNLQDHRSAWPLAEIAAVRATRTLWVVPNGISMQLADGRTERFVLWKRKEWLENIGQAVYADCGREVLPVRLPTAPMEPLRTRVATLLLFVGILATAHGATLLSPLRIPVTGLGVLAFSACIAHFIRRFRKGAFSRVGGVFAGGALTIAWLVSILSLVHVTGQEAEFRRARGVWDQVESGMTREQVRALLGDPAELWEPGVVGLFGKNKLEEWVYGRSRPLAWHGRAPFLGLALDRLFGNHLPEDRSVFFDESGRVLRASDFHTVRSVESVELQQAEVTLEYLAIGLEGLPSGARFHGRPGVGADEGLYPNPVLTRDPGEIAAMLSKLDAQLRGPADIDPSALAGLWAAYLKPGDVAVWILEVDQKSSVSEVGNALKIAIGRSRETKDGMTRIHDDRFVIGFQQRNSSGGEMFSAIRGQVERKLSNAEAALREDLGHLVREFQAEDISRRDRASERLRKLGIEGLPALGQALADATDREVQSRIRDVISYLKARQVLIEREANEKVYTTVHPDKTLQGKWVAIAGGELLGAHESFDAADKAVIRAHPCVSHAFIYLAGQEDGDVKFDQSLWFRDPGKEGNWCQMGTAFFARAGGQMSLDAGERKWTWDVNGKSFGRSYEDVPRCPTVVLSPYGLPKHAVDFVMSTRFTGDVTLTRDAAAGLGLDRYSVPGLAGLAGPGDVSYRKVRCRVSIPELGINESVIAFVVPERLRHDD